MVKRSCDVFAASIALAMLVPLFLMIAILIKIDSPGPVLFKQERIGRAFRPFFIFKFRSMVKDAHKLGRGITVGADPRITRVGRFLRRFKLDELPQVINVLKGDMALVGPRPELRTYVEAFRDDYQQILTVRPGLTDFASLKFIEEAFILGQESDPSRAYRDHILPEKIALAKQYVREQSLYLDFVLLARTLGKLLRAT